MNKRFLFLSTAMVVGLTLLGAGCVQEANQSADTLVEGAVGTPLQALNQAKQLTAAEQARLNREAATDGNLIPVALILTEGNAAPAEAVIGETIGCADQVALIGLSRVAATDRPVLDALNTLLAWKDSSYQDLYNALAFSDLQVDQVVTTDGRTTRVELSGEVVSGGTCDDPRIKAQIEETVRQFHPDFKIILNGDEAAWRCLGDGSGLCE
jgi:hypothetical protein